MKRYEIQIGSLETSLHDHDPRWSQFYSARACRTLRGARKEWWRWVNHEWDFAGDRPLFRIWDRKKKEVVE